MKAIAIQENNTWNPILNNVCDEDMNIKVPPPSPQDLSMLETVFSKHLSSKIHSFVNTHDHLHTHAQTLEKLLLSHHKKPHQFIKRRHYKRPSRIPILSCRIHKKKNRNSMQQDAFERIHVSAIRKKSKKNNMSIQDAIIQDLKDLDISK